MEKRCIAFACRYFLLWMGKIRTGKSLWLLLGFLALALPLRWMAAAAVSIAVHELCHYLAVRLCGGQVYSLYMTAGGIKMHTSPLTPGKHLICALAGPAGGLLLFLLSIKMPRLALCALVHSAWNLLPLYPLDGGRAVENLLVLVFSYRGERIFLWLQRFFFFAVVLACLWASFLKHLGILPLLVAFALLIKSDFLKNPCKDARPAVQ